MIVGKIKDKENKMSTNYEARLGKQAVSMFWKNGNLWWVLKDVCKGIGNSSDVSSRL
jgi:prophage antirepressor-like protein